MNRNFKHIEVPVFEELEANIINNQRWYKTPAGKFPSITTVLGDKSKEWLVEWKNALGEEKAKKITEYSAKRGTNVHLMAEHYLNNNENYTDGQTKQNIALFNQLKMSFKHINNIRVQEIPLYSEFFRVAGRVDLISEFKGILSVVDFKTSNNIKTKDMIEDYFLQCTFYALTYYELFGILIEQIVILIAVEKGLFPLIFVESIHDYIKPLQKRINEFHEKNKCLKN